MSGELLIYRIYKEEKWGWFSSVRYYGIISNCIYLLWKNPSHDKSSAYPMSFALNISVMLKYHVTVIFFFLGITLMKEILLVKSE